MNRQVRSFGALSAPTATLRTAREAAWLADAWSEADPLAVIIGGGLGHGLADRLAAGATTQALVLEPDPRAAARLRVQLAAWTGERDARLVILSGPSYDEARTARRFVGLQEAPVIVHPDLERSHPREVARARSALSRLSFYGIDGNPAARLETARRLLHALANAPRLAQEADVALLAGLFPGVPALVIGAGPSLDHNLTELARVADRAIIIACDAAARPLLAAGITPHFIVTTDTSRVASGHLACATSPESWLVADGSVHPASLCGFAGRTFAFRSVDGDPWPWLAAHGLPLGRLDGATSAITTALALARHVRANPIVFLGADLAFTDGRPYCRGTSFESAWASRQVGGHTIDDVWQETLDAWPHTVAHDVHGRAVRTTPHLSSIRDAVIEQSARDRTVRIMNATNAGLLFGPSIEWATLEDVARVASPLDRALVSRLVRDARGERAGQLGQLLTSTAELLTGRREPLLARWMQAAAGAATMPHIETALRSPELTAWTLAHAHDEVES